MSFTPIHTDQEAVEVIDRLKFALKSRNSESKLANALNDSLNEIINRFALDMDKDAFATLPIGLPRVVFSVDQPEYPKLEELKFEQSIEQDGWDLIPEQNAIVNECDRRFREAVLEYVSPHESKTERQIVDRILNSTKTTEWHPHDIIRMALNDLVDENKIEKFQKNSGTHYRRIVK